MAQTIAEIIPGIYTHYKGKQYQVYDVVTHSETEEKLVVYRCLYGDYDLWVRPLAMFFEKVTLATGEVVDRFALTSTNDQHLE
ncbi:DUF1653 domain-containing protein [Aurantivibrio plasticivorans]